MKKAIPYILIGLLILGFIGIIGYVKTSKEKTSPSNTQTEAYFDESANVMYFYSPNCSACNKEKQILADLAKEGFRVKPMNILEKTEAATQYNIKGTPEFISQKDGARLEGFQEKETLKKWLEEHK
ncbi:thioredoxin [candidate division WS5 bacterium]|uniref:Thioredoxin n=1 Tax=candidate division WS5 bacterium TaxID=2093353 RepID=A0A419DGU6_9BACT|nr:MAG: thioredoxin [candidate division WS5 bacterium]